MKSVRFVIAVSIFLNTICSTFALGQNNPAMPDYTNWDKNTRAYEAEAILDGKSIFIFVETYEHKDEVNLKSQVVYVLNNENGNPWFSYYVEINLKDPKDQKGQQATLYLFEYVINKWEFVEEFDLSAADFDEKLRRLLKERFKFQF